MDGKMKILAIDSSAKAATAAILDGEHALASYTVDNGLTQSELLMPMLESLIGSLGIKYSDIELFAVSSCPGSFTGVRIGAALIKGIAFGRGLPCVGVSTLEALALNAEGLSGLIVPVMDARRSQFYTASFKSDGEHTERLCPDRAIGIDELAEELRSTELPIYLVGDGYALAKRMLLERGVKTENTPLALINENAVSVGRLGYRKYLAGNFGTDSELKPGYLRLPQAERERLERENSNK